MSLCGSKHDTSIFSVHLECGPWAPARAGGPGLSGWGLCPGKPVLSALQSWEVRWTSSAVQLQFWVQKQCPSQTPASPDLATACCPSKRVVASVTWVGSHMLPAAGHHPALLQLVEGNEGIQKAHGDHSLHAMCGPLCSAPARNYSSRSHLGHQSILKHWLLSGLGGFEDWSLMVKYSRCPWNREIQIVSDQKQSPPPKQTNKFQSWAADRFIKEELVSG